MSRTSIGGANFYMTFWKGYFHYSFTLKNWILPKFLWNPFVDILWNEETHIVYEMKQSIMKYVLRLSCCGQRNEFQNFFWPQQTKITAFKILNIYCYL